jgi:hypothetical protein
MENLQKNKPNSKREKRNVPTNHYVYVHTNPKNSSDVWWVGSGAGYRAWNFSAGRNEEYLSKVKEFGMPNVEIVYENLTKEDALDLEKYLTEKIGIESLCIINVATNVSKATRLKLSKSHLGIDNDNLHNYAFTHIQSGITYTFPTLNEGCKELGIDKGNASRVANGILKSIKGYVVKVIEEVDV